MIFGYSCVVPSPVQRTTSNTPLWRHPSSPRRCRPYDATPCPVGHLNPPLDVGPYRRLNERQPVQIGGDLGMGVPHVETYYARECDSVLRGGVISAKADAVCRRRWRIWCDRVIKKPVTRSNGVESADHSSPYWTSPVTALCCAHRVDHIDSRRGARRQKGRGHGWGSL